MSPRVLLGAGTVAGPFFVASIIVHATFRTGFHPAEHPPSALSLGDTGWIQTSTFLVAGLAFLVGAIGLGLTSDRHEGRWAPRFASVFALALMAGGLFPMDPAFGFPPGTPDGVGESVSWHAVIHGIVFPLGFLSICAFGWSMSRRHAAEGRVLVRWMAVLVGPAVLVLSIWPNLAGDPQGRFLPLWLGVILAFLWMSFTFGDAALSHAPSTRFASARHS